jgi:hypothetical protein
VCITFKVNLPVGFDELHRDANVTRAVYLRELSDARRRTMRRSRMIAEFRDVLGAHDEDRR